MGFWQPYRWSLFGVSQHYKVKENTNLFIMSSDIPNMPFNPVRQITRCQLPVIINILPENTGEYPHTIPAKVNPPLIFIPWWS